MLDKNTIIKRQVNNMQLEFKAGNTEKYEIDSI